VLRAERLVRARAHRELVAEALRVGEAQPVCVALGRHALAGQAAGPEVERVGRAHTPDDAVDHAGAGAPRDGARVLEERQLGARVALFVGEEQVVDGGVVLVDRLGDQAQAQDARVEVDVAGGVTGDRRDVVDAVEPHGAPSVAGRSRQAATGT
jgi:hypothetical protein